MKQVMSASILKNKRAQLSQSAILALICAVFLATSVFSVNPLNNAAERSAESLAASTTATLVVLAGINAFLSLAQEFEASITVATVQPLKTLEPVDDLVERVASALLIVTVFSIVLSLAFNPVAGFGWAILLCYFCIKTWTSFDKENNGLVEFSNDTDINQFSRYLIRAGLGLSLVLPVAFLVSTYFGDFLTKAVWQKHQLVLEEVSTLLKDSSDSDWIFAPQEVKSSVPQSDSSNDPLETGFMSGVLGAWDKGHDVVVGIADQVGSATKATVSMVKNYIEAAGIVIAHTDDLIFSLITILAVFIFKVLVLPVIVALIIFGLLKSSGIGRAYKEMPRRWVENKTSPDISTTKPIVQENP